ncbi:hypothetical protein ACOSQ3_018381 [Xanthoceras sorbifolium]
MVSELEDLSDGVLEQHKIQGNFFKCHASSAKAITGVFTFFQPYIQTAYKLDQINYIYWKFRVLPPIRALDLEDFISSSSNCPKKFVESRVEGSDVVEQQVVNEEFLLWKKTDQLLVRWLLSTLNESVLGQVRHCVTSFEVWNNLESLYVQRSKARIRYEMLTSKKGSMTMDEFIFEMNGFIACLAAADGFIACLAAAGQPMLEDDLITHVLGGLGREYDPVVVVVTAMQLQGSITLQEVQFVLMSYENRLAQRNSSDTIDRSQASANLSTNFNGNRGGFQSNRGRFGGRGRVRGRGRFGSRMVCQLCEKPGHIAANCYHRFDHSFQGVSNNQSQQYQGFQGHHNSGAFQGNGHPFQWTN